MKSSGTVLTIYCWLLITLTMAATFTVEIERGRWRLIIDRVLLGNRKLMMMFSKTSISSCLELKHNVNIEIFNTLNTPTSKTFCTIYYFPFGHHRTDCTAHPI